MFLKQYIVILLVLGTLFLPISTYACNSNKKSVENCCSKKSKTSDDDIKPCCKKDKSTSSKSNKGCKGCCNSASCQCNILLPAFILATQMSSIDIVNNVKQKQVLIQDSFYAQGFLSIWKPPNIA